MLLVKGSPYSKSNNKNEFYFIKHLNLLNNPFFPMKPKQEIVSHANRFSFKEI